MSLLRRLLLPLVLAVPFGAAAMPARADEGPANLAISSYRSWCSGAGTCAGLGGTAEYRYAEADTNTFTAPYAGRSSAYPQEVFAVCGHAYSAGGTRYYDQASVQAELFPGTAPDGTVGGNAAVVTPGADTQTAAAVAIENVSAANHQSLPAIGPNGSFITYQAVDAATVNGVQQTDNRTSTILAGGFNIQITGTIAHFRQARDPNYGFLYWQFAGTSTGTLACSTRQISGTATLSAGGRAIYAVPD